LKTNASTTCNTRYALVNLILCSVMHGLNHYLIIFFKPAYPVIKDYFGLVNVADVTTRMTTIYVGYAISNLISGLLSRRFNLRIILFVGMLVMSIAATLVAFVGPDSYGVFVLLIFLMGLGGGTYHPAANTLITSWYEGKPGHAIGMLSVGAAVGFIAAPFIGEYVGVKLHDFRKLFLISGLICFVFNFIFLLTTKDHRRVAASQPETSEPNNATLPPGRVLIAGILLMCIPVTMREIVGWSFYEITPFWVKFGFSGGITIGMVQAMQYIPGVIVQPVTGKLCDWVSPVKMVITAFILMGLGATMLACSVPIVLWIALLLFGIGSCGSIVASETFMATLASSRDRPLVYGVALTIGLGLGGVLAGVSGWVVDLFGREVATGYRVWFLLSGIALMISTSAYFLVRRMQQKHSQSSYRRGE